MSDTKISALTRASSVGVTDLFPIVQSGSNKAATLSVLLDAVREGAGAVATIAALTALTGQSANDRVTVLGYYAAGDGGGGEFYWDAASAATANGGTILAADTGGTGRWKRPELDQINVRSFGAKGDGATNDYAAIQAAVGALKARGNGLLYFPKGTYNVGTAIALTQVKGVGLRGDGPDNTKIVSTAAGQPAVQGNGVWRSFFDGIQFTTSAALTGKAVFELDGNYDGSNTQGVQGNHFRNCYFVGAQLADYAFAITRQGGGSGQGSENLFLGCNFDSGLTASFLINGANALQNTLIGGNFQAHSKHGLQITAGNANLFSVGFQSTYGYTQIVNGGYDIDNSTFSTGDRTIVDSCRTESLRFYRGGGAQVNIRGLAHVPATNGWSSGAKSLNAIVWGTTAAGKRRVYRVTTAGTTDASEPTWPESGTVADGSVVWTQLDFSVIEGVSGQVEGGQILYGQVSGNDANFTKVHFTRDDIIYGEDPISGSGPLFIDCIGKAYPSNTPFAFTIGNNAASGARSTATNIFNLSNRAIVFTEGSGGGTFYDVGIARGMGDYNDKAKNTLKVAGGVELTSVTFAQLVAGVNNGVLYYCTDATPSSNPATGSGSGAFVVRENGAWRAL